MMEKENVEENHEQEEGVTTKTTTTTKKKKKKTKEKMMMSEEHESSDLNSHSLVIALPATKKLEEGKKNVAVKKDGRKKKIGNAVENVEEGSVSEKKKTKKKRNKKKKGISDATENVEDSKMELDEESMQDLMVLVNPKPDSKMTESCKEMGLEEKKINRKKKKKKRDKNEMEVTQEFLVEGKMEVGLPTAADGSNEAVSEHCKIKRRKKKRCLLSGIVDMEQKALEEAMRELMVKVKPASAAQTEENHMEVDTEMKKRKKKKKKRHGSSECTKMDTKPSEYNLQDLSVKENPEAVQQTVENQEEVSTGQKVKKQQLSSSENGDGNQSQLKSNLEMKLSNTLGNALLTSENHEEMSAVEKRRTKRKKKRMTAHEHDGGHQKMLEEGSLELQLPVESGLKASLIADENHVSRMKDKSTVCKVKASNDPSAHDLSIKQSVEKSGVSSSELLREVKQCPTIGGENKEISATDCNKEKGLCYASIGDASPKDFGVQDGTSKEGKSAQIVLDLPKSAPISCTRRKLLILDLNGLLLDIVMVVPRGYKAEQRIGLKSVFKRPFCDEFLKFCFERFEVGVWTSRTKRNMDDVLDFLMADTKHKLLFCWDQSHCTMTGINTIDNRHKPLVCKELRKLWDKHEPSLPWEKGEYNESNTLLLDDSPYKALLNPPNTAIFPYSYSLVDRDDNSLGPEGDIRLYLEGVATAEDVQKYVKQHPFGQPAITNTSSSWGFYCRVFDHFKRQLD